MDLSMDASHFLSPNRVIPVDEILPTLDQPLRNRLTLAVLTVAAVAAIYNLILYPAFISPLSKLPAPHWSCHYSGLWLLWVKFQERENREMLDGHRKLGPTIRISPNMVHFNSMDGIKAIYLGNFPRAHWYWGAFRNYE